MATQLVNALIHEEDGVFGISFPDFPGCVASGATAEEAFERGSSVLAFHVAGMLEDGDVIPRLRSMKEIADQDGRALLEGATWVRVPLDLPGKAIRINVSLEDRLVEQIDRAAKASGVSRSGFLAEAAKVRLRGTG